MKKSAAAGGLAVAIAAVLVTGCSSSGKASSSSTGGTSGGGSTATGSPLKFYVIGPSNDDTLNGPTEGKAGVQAAVAAINKAGGVDGHPLQPVFCGKGPGSNANDIGACARNAAADSSVSAVVWAVTNYGNLVDPVLEKAGMACVGCTPYTPADFASPNVFAVEPGALNVSGLASLAVDKLGAKKLDLAIPDVPAGRGLPPLINNLVLAPRHLSVDRTVYVPLTAVDVTSQANQVSGADVVINTLLGGSQPSFLQSMRQQGSKAKTIIAGGTAGASGIAKSFGSGADGLYVGSPFNHSSAGYQAYLADMKAIGKDNTVDNCDQAVAAWLSVQLFKKAALQLNGKPTRAGALSGIKSITSFDSQGLTTPIDFSKPGSFGGGHFPSVRVDTAYLLQYKNGQLVPQGDATHIFGGTS